MVKAFRRWLWRRRRRRFALGLMCADISFGGEFLKHAAMAARAVRNADALMEALGEFKP